MATGLRERKKQETRHALSIAAIRLAVERGYDAVRVEDIAEAAGVSPRTFNNYFSSKADAITARYLDRVFLVAGELQHRPAGEPLWTAIRAAVDKHFAFGVDDADTTTPTRQWIAGVRLTLTEPALRGHLERANALAAATLAAAIGQRTGTDPGHDIYPKLVAAVLSAAMAVVAEQWTRADPPVPLRPIIHAVLDQVAAGLPEPNRKVES